MSSKISSLNNPNSGLPFFCAYSISYNIDNTLYRNDIFYVADTLFFNHNVYIQRFIVFILIRFLSNNKITK